MSPGSFLFILLITGISLLFLKKEKLAKRVLGCTGILLMLIAFLPLGSWLVTPLEQRFPPNPELPLQIDGIIVLGGAVDPVKSYVWNQAEFGSAADRYHAFIELAEQYPRARLIFTGGSGSLLDQDYREADIARHFLESMGIDSRQLETERDSRNTFENAVNSKALMKPEPGENWILITSAAHMPRSVGVFCGQDWQVIPWPVDHESAPGFQNRLGFDFADNLSKLNSYTREWAGLTAYFVTGKIPSLLPNGCRG